MVQAVALWSRDHGFQSHKTFQFYWICSRPIRQIEQVLNEEKVECICLQFTCYWFRPFCEANEFFRSAKSWQHWHENRLETIKSWINLNANSYSYFFMVFWIQIEVTDSSCIRALTCEFHDGPQIQLRSPVCESTDSSLYCCTSTGHFVLTCSQCETFEVTEVTYGFSGLLFVTSWW